MSEIDTGGPAFPTATLAQKTEGGMTLRDYFAAKSIQGLLASTKVIDIRIIADDAYAMADSMLKARKAQ